MELYLIDYLEQRNFDVEEILLFQRRLIHKNTDDAKLIKKMDVIYKVFKCAGLTNLAINKLIANNLKLLYKSDHELINIAYAWKETGVLVDAVERKDGINSDNPLRTYLRNLYLNSHINSRNTPISYDALRKGDSEFVKDQSGLLNGIDFAPAFENLIQLYGEGSTYEEKQRYLESVLSTSALTWYLECLKLERQKANNGKSI